MCMRSLDGLISCAYSRSKGFEIVFLSSIICRAGARLVPLVGFGRRRGPLARPDLCVSSMLGEVLHAAAATYRCRKWQVRVTDCRWAGVKFRLLAQVSREHQTNVLRPASHTWMCTSGERRAFSS